MRTKKYLAGVFLAAAVSFAAAPAVFAAGESQQVTASANQQTERTAVKKENGKNYLYDNATGKKVTGKKGVREYPAGSGNYYYFKTSGGQIAVGSLIKKKTSYYYAQDNGILKTGFQKVGKYTYYFNTKDHKAAVGWKKVSGKYYYFNSKGIQLTGLQTIKKKVYYLNPADNGARAVGWAKVGKKWEYFDKKGKRLTGLITDKDTKLKYYISKKGVRVTGLTKIKGATYYFDKNNGVAKDGSKVGGAMTTGWATVKGKTYYFGKSGKAVTGWLTKSKKKYYFNSSGVMQTGTINIGSKMYTFDKTTGALKSTKEVSGPYSIKVNQTTNVVTIYQGSTPVKAMLCSVGLNGATPNGTFTLHNKRHWHELFGNCWGQYTCTITGNILFHSVYYLRYRDNNSLATAEFRKLGQAASHGCVRLSCADAYYIYTYCPTGTKVTIFRGSAKDDPLGKPANQYAGWTGNYDPTDPNPND